MKIALVGIGPRNLLVLHDLVKDYEKSHVKKLTIYVIDRYPIGGRVWITNQDLILNMDTMCQQITMFPHGEGPNLYQWIKSNAKNYLETHHYPHSHQLLKLLPKVKKMIMSHDPYMVFICNGFTNSSLSICLKDYQSSSLRNTPLT